MSRLEDRRGEGRELDRKAATLERGLEWAARDETYLTPERVERYFASGAWSCDTLFDRFETWVERQPEKPMVIDQAGNATTYRQFHAMAYAFGASLVELGFLPGDTVVIQLPNCVELMAATVGAARVGVVPTYANMGYRSHELRHLMTVFSPRGYLCVPEMRGFDFIASARELQAEFPHLERIITIRAPEIEGTLRFDGLVERGSGQELPEKPLATDLFVVMPTSGTTGRPKGVMHTHASLLCAIDRYVHDTSWGSSDHWVVVTPMTHFLGLALPFLFSGLAYGGSCTLTDGWDAAKALELMERDHVTHIMAAPPMFYGILREPSIATRDLSSLRHVMYGGAPCPVEVLKQLAAAFPKAQLEAWYGSSEMLATSYTRHGDPMDVISTTVGKIAFGFEAKVVDEEGSEVPHGTPGELWGRGETLAMGYFRDPEGIRARYLGDWFRTGDVMTLGIDGNYTYTARADDIINRGGFKVDPRELEEVLFRHPKVAQAAVVGFADPALGHRVLVHIVARDQAHPPALEELRDFLAQQGVAKVKWPEGLVLHQQLPMTPSGKVLKYELRKIAATA